jgi:hypothetical protein
MSRVLGRAVNEALLLAGIAVAGLPLLVATPMSALAQDDHAQSEHGSLADVGAKLSDPTSNVWALFTEFDLTFSDGDVNTGDSKIGGQMLFQPIMPIIFSNSVPTGMGFNRFDHYGGLGDTVLPLPLVPPAGSWLLGLGPTFLFPTATKDAFGSEQWGIGPTAIIGYKTKDWVLGVFPQYYFKIGSIGDQADKPNMSSMSLLYFGFLNLPDAWQVGFNPVITYDDKATKGNKWNVPLGLVVTKTTAIARQPVKFQFGIEYSVVSQDDFGKRFLIKLNVIPVISALVKNPIFGGN